MNNPKQLFIIGGGYSIQPHLKDLQSRLHDKFVIGLNYAYHDFPDATFISYVDICNDYESRKGSEAFYNKERDNLKDFPLIIGRKGGKIVKIYDNVICLKETNNAGDYRRDLSKGVYKHSLVGVWALAIGIYLLNIGEIYLLGYDFGIKANEGQKVRNVHDFERFGAKDEHNRYISHYNQHKITHEGITKESKLAYYYSHEPDSQFGVFKRENKIKIWNVSLESRIPEGIFEKLSYKDFFNKIDNLNYNQDELRDNIKEKFKKHKAVDINPFQS